MARSHWEAAVKYARSAARSSSSPPQIRWAAARFCEWIDQRTHAFDRTLPDRICAFIELLPYPQGSWGTEFIRLMPWQLWCLFHTFGFRNPDGSLLVRESLIAVPRKNGKSTLAGAVALHELTARGRNAPKVIFAAPTEKQSRHSYGQALLMLQKSDQLRRAYKMTGSDRQIISQRTHGRAVAISGNAQTADGYIPTLVCYDEIHAAENPDTLEIHRTSLAATSDPLIFLTTTAGDLYYSVGTIERDFYLAQARGDVQDDSKAGWLWEADIADDPMEEATWIKCCPSYGVSASKTFYASQAAAARLDEDKLAFFRSRQLNQWRSGTADSWLDMNAWTDAPEPPPLEKAAASSKQFFIGLDLAERFDLCSLCIATRTPQGRIQAWWKHWTPRRLVDAVGDDYATGVREGSRAMLAQWARAGWLQQTDASGDRVDLAAVADTLTELHELLRGKLKMIVLDQFAGVPLFEDQVAPAVRRKLRQLRKTATNFTQPARQIEQWLAERKLEIQRCPVAAWAAANVVVDRRIDGSLLPKKRTRTAPEKIDPIDALILAVAGMDAHGGRSSGGMRTQQRAPLTIGEMGLGSDGKIPLY